jgi:hypothetical protein
MDGVHDEEPFLDGLYIPHSLEALTYACTHTLVLGLLAFYSVTSTMAINRKPHTYVFTSHIVVIVYDGAIASSYPGTGHFPLTCL